MLTNSRQDLLPAVSTDLAKDTDVSDLFITAGNYHFEARFEVERAPLTVAAFRKLLPFTSQLIHVRWSGEGVWIPLGDADFGVAYENHTSFPSRGDMLLYAGGISETELILAYGGVHFKSRMGQLAGNHFLTITSNHEDLAELGRDVLWKGAQPITIVARA